MPLSARSGIVRGVVIGLICTLGPLHGCSLSPSADSVAETDSDYLATRSTLVRMRGCYSLDISEATEGDSLFYLAEFPDRFALLPVDGPRADGSIGWALTTREPLPLSIMRIVVKPVGRDSLVLGTAVWDHYPVELRLGIGPEGLVGRARRWSDEESADTLMWIDGPRVRAVRVRCEAAVEE